MKIGTEDAPETSALHRSDRLGFEGGLKKKHTEGENQIEGKTLHIVS